MEKKQKSPLQIVADEIEYKRLKSLISDRFKHVEDAVYERIKKEMHTKHFNEVLAKVIELHGTKDAIEILCDCIQKVASESVLKIVAKSVKIKKC